MALVNVSIEEFLNQSCCKKNCISSFDLADIERIRDSFLDLTSEEKDTVLLGFFMQWFKPGDHLSSDVDYRMEGKKICRKSFLFLTNISKTKLQNLRSHYHQEGLQSRRHGNTGRAPPNSHSFETRETVKNLIENYADNHDVIQLLREQLEHLDVAEKEREYYNRQCQTKLSTQEKVLIPPSHLCIITLRTMALDQLVC